jgi:hypothetical protein
MPFGCAACRQTPALRLLAQELSVLLCDQYPASVTTTAATGVPIARWSAAAGSGAESRCG